MGFLGALLGGLAGGSNTRPPSLDPTQRTSLDALIKNLMPTATGAPKIDPLQQSLLYGQNAQSLTGANNQATHALTSRGLGTSGLLAQALMQNANQSQVNQGNINLGLQNQAIQQKQLYFGIARTIEHSRPKHKRRISRWACSHFGLLATEHAARW